MHVSDLNMFLIVLGNIYRQNHPDKRNFHGGDLALVSWGVRHGLVTDEEQIEIQKLKGA